MHRVSRPLAGRSDKRIVTNRTYSTYVDFLWMSIS